MNEETALHYHLQFNHYPPVTTKMIPYCQDAIHLAEQELWDDRIVIRDKGGRMDASVRQLVNDLHLHDFIEVDDG